MALHGWMEASSASPGRFPAFGGWNVRLTLLCTRGVRIRRSAFAPGKYPPAAPPWEQVPRPARSPGGQRCAGLYTSNSPECSSVCLRRRLTGRRARKQNRHPPLEEGWSTCSYSRGNQVLGLALGACCVEDRPTELQGVIQGLRRESTCKAGVFPGEIVAFPPISQDFAHLVLTSVSPIV